MAAELLHWERRDGADRAAFGLAAYELCRATRAQDGVRNCRFFWVTPDRIAVLREADSAQVFGDSPKPELARALFELADLAVQVDLERWTEPRAGQEAYAIAGRV